MSFIVSEIFLLGDNGVARILVWGGGGGTFWATISEFIAHEIDVRLGI